MKKDASQISFPSLLSLMIVTKTPSLLDSIPITKEQDMEQSSDIKATDAGDSDQEVDFYELLSKIAAKDVPSLEVLHDAMANTLMSVIYNVLNNQSESEDILQEAFVTIWNKAGSYQSALGKPKSWMITIARNKALDRYRSLSRKADGKSAYKEHQEINIQNTPKTEHSEQIELAMQKLNPDQKKAIELVFYKGLTQQEVATQLETPLGTIKARVRRGLQFLKTTLTSNANHG